MNGPTSKPAPANFPQHAVRCTECDKRMECRIGKYGPFYRCESIGCNITIAAINSGHRKGAPMGTPAGREDRYWRARCHKAVDPLWESGFMARNSVYALIAHVAGIPREKAHIGDFTKEQCQRVIAKLTEANLYPFDPIIIPPDS